MDLITDPSIDGLTSTIGGMNSSSMIPFLDFERIRAERKIICGFSDVTSLHMAILKYAGLSTVYGPSVMCWFGEWPDGIPESSEWFLQAVSKHKSGMREIQAPARWSNHRRRWDNGDWKTIPRNWETNKGWKVLSHGEAEGLILALNLNTLLSAAGTPYWPDFKDRVLLIEDMYAPMSRTERSLRQLSLIGVFDQISGLIVGKSEDFASEGAPFSYDDLIQEVVGKRPYPIISQFDCGHCVPMISIPQLVRVHVDARGVSTPSFRFLEGGIE